jgi:glycosyltransferase involved in cell wall biosynthesis
MRAGEFLKVLALASYPERMAATRFRMSRYIPYLAKYGIEVQIVPWLDDRAASQLYQRGMVTTKVRAAFTGALRQVRAANGQFDVVWVQREAMLAGPPFIEARVRARDIPLVLDYDDAIWIAQGDALKRAVKFAWKFDWVLRRAAHAIAGSNYLAERARSFGVPVTVLPTTVERKHWRPIDPAERERELRRPLVIGWIGTHSTAPQLSLATPALRRLHAEGHSFRVLVIGADAGFRLEGLEIEARAWALDCEIDDFRNLDIGITPMFSSPWYEGKCAFKQIQLMAVGVPFVSSMVGGARDFLVDEENALIAHTEDDWYRQLRRLLTDGALRERLGRAGRELVERRLCIEEQAKPLADALRAAANSGEHR